MIAAEGSLLTALTGMNTAPTDHLLLHLHEYFPRDDRIMIVLDIILGHMAVVLAPLFCQEVLCVGFL